MTGKHLGPSTYFIFNSGNCAFNLSSCLIVLRPAPFFSWAYCKKAARNSSSDGSTACSISQFGSLPLCTVEHTMFFSMLVLAIGIGHTTEPEKKERSNLSLLNCKVLCWKDESVGRLLLTFVGCSTTPDVLC
jgi:hypothetical protein